MKQLMFSKTIENLEHLSVLCGKMQHYLVKQNGWIIFDRGCCCKPDIMRKKFTNKSAA